MGLKEKIKIIGEYVSYLFILSIFINSKLNMKIAYFLLLLGIFYCVLFYREIKINKKVYYSFLALLLLGSVINYFIFEDGISYYIRENSRFLYALPLTFFLSSKNEKKINLILNLGILILCIDILSNNSLFFQASISRQRGILFLGLIYLMIKSIEEVLDKKYKEISIISSLIAIYTMIFLNSRMAILSIVVVLFLYCFENFILKKNYQKIFKFFVIIFLICGVFYIFSPKIYKEHLKTSFYTKNNSSNEARIIMWKAGYEIFKNHKLLGIGSNPERAVDELIKHYSDKIKDPNLKEQFINERQYARLHSIYIDFIVQNGILGILYIIILLVIIPLEYIKAKKTKMTRALFYSVISFYIYGLTWSVWSDYGIIQMLFQVILALFLCCIDNKKIFFTEDNKFI